MRSADPAAAARAFVAAGRVPDDPANRAARATVKVCGITDAEGILAAVRAGADAIGLNLVAGTPRELSLAEATALARVARSLSSRPPAVVAITADAGRERMAEIIRAIDPDAVQLSGDETVDDVAAVGRPVWKALRVAADHDDPARSSRGPRLLAAGAARILLDAAGGPHRAGRGRGSTRRLPPQSPARCRSSSPAASTPPTPPAPSATSPPSASTAPPAPSDRASRASVRPRIRYGWRST